MKKKIIVLLSILFLTYSLSIFADKHENIADILSKTNNSEHIKIIIKFQVPDLEKYTINSIKFRTGNIPKAKDSEVKQADNQLANIISESADNLFFSLNNYNYSETYVYKTIPYTTMTVDSRTLNKLDNLEEVLEVYPNKPIPLPKYKKNTIKNKYLSNPCLNDSIDIIGADTAWGFGLTGKNWYVAVLDTGIRTTHEMFKGKTIIEQCYSENNDCPNGQKIMSGNGSASHYYDHSDVFGYDHGSHVTGIATGNNGKNLFGVAKDANIIAVQVFSYFPSENAVMSWGSDQLKGLEFVYSLRNNYNISSINMSLGGDTPYSTYCDTNMLKPAIDNLKSVGIATVIASGNESYCNALSSPACISSAISVDGSSKYDQEYSFGNWQNEMLDLLAPGVDIKSVSARNDTSYAEHSGTSMAAPHVAGAWAILKQYNPRFTVKEVLDMLKKYGTQLNQKSSCGNFTITKPRIDLDTTVSKLFSILPPINFSANKVENKSLLQTEYINILNWEKNPKNDGNNIVSYKTYRYENNIMVYLGTVNAGVYTYSDRNVGIYTSITYAVTAVNDKEQESIPYYYTITF